MITQQHMVAAACAFQRLEQVGAQTCPLYAYRRWGRVVYGLAGSASAAAKLAAELGRSEHTAALEALAALAGELESAADAADAAAGYADDTARVWLGKTLYHP